MAAESKEVVSADPRSTGGKIVPSYAKKPDVKVQSTINSRQIRRSTPSSKIQEETPSMEKTKRFKKTDYGDMIRGFMIGVGFIILLACFIIIVINAKAYYGVQQNPDADKFKQVDTASALLALGLFLIAAPIVDYILAKIIHNFKCLTKKHGTKVAYTGFALVSTAFVGALLFFVAFLIMILNNDTVTVRNLQNTYFNSSLQTFNIGYALMIFSLFLTFLPLYINSLVFAASKKRNAACKKEAKN